MSVLSKREKLLTEAENSPDSGMENSKLPYVLFSVGKNIYGISSQYVISIEIPKEVTTIIDSPPHTRGGIIFDESFINIIDMRILFGLDSQIDEFIQAVNPEQRMRDHENWVSALEKSVREKTAFTLTDNPRQCAFGKWFYSFKSDNHTLSSQLGRMEAPHAAVHETAKLIKKLMAENKHEEALSAISELRATHYKTTMSMLASLRDTVAANVKELFIIINADNGVIGISVDSIVSIEDLDEELPLPSFDGSGSRYVKFISRRKGDRTPVLVLNAAMIK